MLEKCALLPVRNYQNQIPIKMLSLHLKGWTHMTPERVDAVRERAAGRSEAASVA